MSRTASAVLPALRSASGLLSLHRRRWAFTFLLIVALCVFYYGFVDSHSLARLFFFELKRRSMGGLLLLPFAYAVVALRLPGALVSWTVGFLAILPWIIRYSLSSQALATNIFFFVLPFFILLTVLLELQWREKHRALERERENERRTHVAQVYATLEEERHRIAQGLHDDILQRLLAIAYMAKSACSTGKAESRTLGDSCAEIHREALSVAEDLRRLSYDLRPSILDDLGLASAVRWLSGRLQEDTGIECDIQVRGRFGRFDPKLETVAFRIVQEALNNIRSHSAARHATVVLGLRTGYLTIDVSDDGTGFPAKKVLRELASGEHLGLLGMTWRVHSVHGTLTIRSSHDTGTRVSARLPCQPMQRRPREATATEQVD